LSSAALWAALALLAIALAGAPFALALRLRGALLVASCWLLGAGVLAGAMLVCSVLGLAYSRQTLALVWLLVVGAGVALMLRSYGSVTTHPPQRLANGHIPPAAALILLATCAFQILFVTLQAIRAPLGSFDSWSLWEFKGRHFWLDQGVSGRFLADHSIIFAHPAYPPLLPLLMAWVYTWAGTAEPVLMKPIFPCFFATLLLAFFAALQPRVGVRLALPATAALALLPRMAEYAGTGLADVPLAAYLVAAAATITSTDQRRSALTCGIFLGLALSTKHEGLVFFAAAVLSLALVSRLRPLLVWVTVPALCIGAPWYLYVSAAGVPDRDFLPMTIGNLVSHSGRFGPIARLFSLNLLAVDEWLVLWFAFGAALIIALRRHRMRAAALLPVVVLPLVVYVVSLTLSAWPDPMLHVRTSLDRLILVTTPFALWFVTEQFALPMDR